MDSFQDYRTAIKSFSSVFFVFSPSRMSECDIIQLCPACKHMLLCYKAMVVPSPTSLVLKVCHTFIGSPGLIVVVRHFLGSLFPPKEEIVLNLQLLKTHSMKSSQVMQRKYSYICKMRPYSNRDP